MSVRFKSCPRYKVEWPLTSRNAGQGPFGFCHVNTVSTNTSEDEGMASIRKHVTKSGETTFKVLFRLSTGKQSSRTFDTEKAAEKFRARIDATSPDEAAAWLDGLDERPESAGALTVDALFEAYMADKTDLTDRVAKGYRRDYANWIKDRLGSEAAADVDEVAVQKWVDWMKSAPKLGDDGKPIRDEHGNTTAALSAKSVADRHAILSGMFKWGSARTRRLVPGNPCMETELPKRKKTSVKGLRLQELRWLLAAGESVGEGDAADLTAFLAGTGWRISEAIALDVGAVEVLTSNTGKPLVYVTMGQVYRRGEGLVDDAKSSQSYQRRLRVIGPGADVVLRRIVGKGPMDPVFTFVDGRPGKRSSLALRWNPTTFRERRFPLIVEAAGLSARGVTPHWLRHTHVAVCIALGMSLAEIQRRLGHEDIRTTINTYGRMFEELTQEMVDRADEVMRPELNKTIQGGVVIAGEIVQNNPEELQ